MHFDNYNHAFHEHVKAAKSIYNELLKKGTVLDLKKLDSVAVDISGGVHRKPTITFMPLRRNPFQMAKLLRRIKKQVKWN